MYIVLGVVGDVIVDHHADVVDIDTARHDVGGDEQIDIARLKVLHDLFALLLRQVRVHLLDADVETGERGCELLDLELGAGEDDRACRGCFAEELRQDGQLLALIADIGGLHDALGRAGDSQLDLGGVVQDGAGELLDLRWHRRREHHALTVLRQRTVDLHDVLLEAHVEHAVSLVEHEVRHSREVCLLEVHQGQETPWRGDDDLCPESHTTALLLPGDPVRTAVDSY